MSEGEAFCRRCKTRVTFVVTDGVAVCPSCGQSYEPNEITHFVKNDTAKGGEIIKFILIVILFLAGLSLVVLAFMFAECARELRNI